MAATNLLLALVLVTTVSCYCPKKLIHGIGPCSYRIQCFETIKDIQLEKKCYGSSNNDVRIDVILQNATDTFHSTADPDFLSMITTINVVGNWPKTDLLFLDSMHRLRNLYLGYNNIRIIIASPLHSLVNLEVIDLSHNQISEIDELFQFDSKPIKLRKLSLAYNRIEVVPGDAFDELKSLNELDLSHNLITELSEEPFCNLTNLEILRLNNNKIIDLNGAMNTLINLEHLYLGNNQIKNINEESLKTTHHLKTFNIANNKIEVLEPVVFSRDWKHFGNHSICRIIISGNYIHYIPNTAFDFLEKHTRNTSAKPTKVITDLDISNNAISDIHYNAFKSIGKLVSLDLSVNKLLTFNVSSEDLLNVKFLNLSCNFLTELYYGSFSLMYNLQNLDLSHNSMDYFPDRSLSNSYNLKYINVTNNDISEIHNLRITFRPYGGVLDLSKNRISSLNIPVNEALGLTELILSSNNITKAYLIRLTEQRDITKIDMSKNFIRELDEFSLQLPEKLAYLDLSFNEIQKIGPSTFHHVNQLKTLKLSHNQLRDIEYGVFSNLTSLMTLDLSYNEIKFLDAKVFVELKSLSVLLLQYNGLNYFQHDSWLARKNVLRVYIDGNELSCEWLAKALNDYKNGYSKMYPAVLVQSIGDHSIEGISCKQDNQNIMTGPEQIMDERLLITSQKILEAVQDQTSYLKKYMWLSILQNERKVSKKNY